MANRFPTLDRAIPRWDSRVVPSHPTDGLPPGSNAKVRPEEARNGGGQHIRSGLR